MKRVKAVALAANWPKILAHGPGKRCGSKNPPN